MRYVWMMAALISTATVVVAQEPPQTKTKALPSEMAIFYLQSADVTQAVELIENLMPEELRKGGPRLLPEPRINALYVQGDAAFQTWVEAFLLRYDKDAESRTLRQVSEAITEIVPLEHVEPQEALVVIESLGLVGDSLSVAVSPGTQRLIVRGEIEAVKELASLLHQIDEPVSKDADAQGIGPGEDTVVVTLHSDGQVLMAGKALAAGTFEDSIGQDTTVMLEIDQDVHHSKVVALIEQLKKMGVVRLSLRANAVPEMAGSTPAVAGKDSSNVEAIPGLEPLHNAYVSAERAAAETAAQWRTEKKRSPDNAGRLNALAGQLEEEVRAAFRLRQQWQQVQLDRSRAELDRLSARVGRREQIANQIIEHRIRELQTGQDLTWLPARSDSGRTKAETKDERFNAVLRPGSAAFESKPPMAEEMPAGPTKAKGDIFTLSNGGRRLAITARSIQHADEIAKLLDEHFPEEGRQSSETEFVIDGQPQNLDQIKRFVKDLDVRRQLKKDLEAASQVPVRFYAGSAEGISWALDGVEYNLPAEFKLDSGQRLLLKLEDVSAIRGRSMFASIEIAPLSDAAVDYFSSHRLSVALSVPDLVRAWEGREIVKRYYLQQSDGELRLMTYSTADPDAVSQPSGDLVATVTAGNVRPELSGDPVRSRSITRGSRTTYDTSDSVVFVEMIVSPLIESGGSAQRRAIYMDGVAVGDEGLIAVVTDELADDSGELKVNVESITLKTHRGKAIYDAKIVETDQKSGLALLLSNELPVPAFRLDGPEVVDSQGLQLLGRTVREINGGRVFKEAGWADDTQVLEPDGYEPKRPGRFLVSGNGSGIPGSAVTLSTTGQLVGIYTAAQTRERKANFDGDARDVIAVSVIDDLIRRFRQE